MFHTMPFGIGVCVSIFDSSYTSAFAPPRPHGPFVQPHTPARLKL